MTCSLSHNAQAYLGNEWFVGIQLQKIKFIDSLSYTPLELDTITKSIGFGNSNICDSNGHLILATDGIKVFDSLGQYMLGGGESINNDSIAWYYGFNASVPNSSIIIPKKNNIYYIFIATMSNEKFLKAYNFIDTFDFDEIRYSIVDMNANDGKGQITVRNKLLLHVDEYPYLNKSNFTACRHANGRDWWLLKSSARSRQVLYSFLVSPDTIITFKNNLPVLFANFVIDSDGQSCFSRDGRLYAEVNNYSPHSIYDFDRCSGGLYLKRIIDLKPYMDTFGFATPGWSGVCFSPNNRFLYANDPYNIYQIDLWEPDDAKAIRRVSKDTNAFNFHQYASMQLTPTNAIYLGNWHGISPYINAILYPDKLGDSCGFVFNYFTAIGVTKTPPNMPFYGLGALKGSPCDTLNPTPPVVPPLIQTSIKVYPNPVSEMLTIELPSGTKKASVQIYTLLGQLITTKTFTEVAGDKIYYSVKHLANALYSMKIIADNERYVGKLLKE